MTWTTTSVRNFEAGKFALTLQNLTALALVLGELTGERFKLVDLFARAMDLGEGFPQRLPVEDVGYLRREWLEQVLNGGEVWADVTSHVKGAEYRDSLLAEAPAMLKRAAASIPQGMDFDDLREASQRESTLAERRAAVKLDTSAPTVTMWAQHLWGHSLDEEAADRAGVGASPQRRGFMTRELVAEIAEAVEGNASGNDQ